MKKIFLKRISMLLLLFIFIAILFTTSFASTKWFVYHLLPTWSVDSGKHLDWGGSTKYSQNFSTAVNTWNNYKSGVIRKDTALTIKDITISDVGVLEGTAIAVTHQLYNKPETKSTSATMQFSTKQMDKLSNIEKTITCTHELGHALGLAENNDRGTNVIMYNSIHENTSNNILHSDDKANYDYMYNNKY